MNQLQQWLITHKISSHTLAAAATTVFTLYLTDTDFASAVNGVLQHHPKLLAGLATAATIYLRYSNAKKLVSPPEVK